MHHNRLPSPAESLTLNLNLIGIPRLTRTASLRIMARVYEQSRTSHVKRSMQTFIRARAGFSRVLDGLMSSTGTSTRVPRDHASSVYPLYGRFPPTFCHLGSFTGTPCNAMTIAATRLHVIVCSTFSLCAFTRSTTSYL